MPTYQYSCTECGHFFEQFQRSPTTRSRSARSARAGCARSSTPWAWSSRARASTAPTAAAATTQQRRRPAGRRAARRARRVDAEVRRRRASSTSAALEQHAERRPAPRAARQRGLTRRRRRHRRHNGRVSHARCPQRPPLTPPEATRRRRRDRPRWVRWTAVRLRWLGYIAVLVARARRRAVFAVVAVRKSFPQTSGTIDVTGPGGRGHRPPRRRTACRRSTPTPPRTCSSPRATSRPRTGSTRWTCAGTSPSGRLSEMFGEDTLETDKVVRTLGWRRVAEQELAS